MLEQPYDGGPEGIDRVPQLLDRLAIGAVLALLAIVALVVWVSFAHAQEYIACADGICIVPMEHYQQLRVEAAATHRYAAMCNWPGFKDED